MAFFNIVFTIFIMILSSCVIYYYIFFIRYIFKCYWQISGDLSAQNRLKFKIGVQRARSHILRGIDPNLNDYLI